MARDLPVGNGNLLVAFDKNYQLREFYFPHIGQENHTMNDIFRLGVWVDGEFSWVDDSWKIHQNYLDDTLVTEVKLQNDKLRIAIVANDLVDFHENIYLKKLSIKNLAPEKREIRIFFTHEFHIYGNDLGDTAAYRPEVRGLLHYKDERYFLINICRKNVCGIDQYVCGEKQKGRLEGAFKDAEDGVLSGNPIAQGSVDSVVAAHFMIEGNSEDECFYWICAGHNWEEVKTLNTIVNEKTPAAILKRTADYWNLWANKEQLNKDLLPESVCRLYKRSLLIMRTQIDNCGSIIAANDSDNAQFNRDTYSYMWPRDGALIAHALDLAGYSEISRRFFNHCKNIVTKEGYFLHKYNPSGTVASSWHPWVNAEGKQLPIQEDETALVLWALWQHYVIYKDIEFIKPLYKPLVKNAADFMLRYRDKETGLPLPSYDLWEERRGVLTFTAASVYGGLMAAANFANAFGETELSDSYIKGASEIKAAIKKHLYLEDTSCFVRMINFDKDGNKEVDATLDASMYSVFSFGCFDSCETCVEKTMQQLQDRLWCNTEIGGLARYENDGYYRVSAEVPGNPWFITTLWLAQYKIAAAKTKEELEQVLELLEWVVKRALPSGVLSEQIDPFTGKPLSVSPLTWSHGAFIRTVQEYLNKLTGMVNQVCENPKYVKPKLI